jgi:UDP-N-acetylmuramyl pentapeptide phosphotransferase/UDP-N-acetylglucosamine-1-phosphate transferase
MAAAPALAAIAVLALLSSSLLTWAWIRLASNRRLLDLPGDRRLHDQPTPRGGGIGIFLLCLATMGCLAWANDAEQRQWGLSALGLATCAGAGLLDDLGRLGTAGKLAMQMLSVLLLVLAWIPEAMATGQLVAASGWFAFGLLLVNFSNFMDGSDGLLALQAILVVAGLVLLAGLAAAATLLAVLFIAATLGFLPFNFPRARVFLGDVGSHAIGYSLALLVLVAGVESRFPLALLALLPSALLLDAGLTLASRIMRGERFWQPHTGHLYQRALRRGVSKPRIALGYAAWTLAAVLLASVVAAAGWKQQWLATSLVFVMGLSLWLALGRRWAVAAEGARA